MSSIALRQNVADRSEALHAELSKTAAPVTRGDPEWYRDAVIYQLHIKAFCDSNGDGIGDIPGLIGRLDYVQQLGVTALWLLPFYPSPLRDDGYDIADYTAVHPSYGTLDDFKRLVEAAHERGIRIITELVINHTSDIHPWFQRARLAPPGSPERDFYVWSDSEDRYQGTRIIFVDSENSNWTWDKTAGAYFWHRFYSHQPDLNFENPLVFDEIVAAMRFWLDMGVDGLRLDAVPYLCEREGTNNENLPATHDVLRRIRAEIDANYPDRMLLAEANQWPEDTRPYFGEGDECHMAFHFPLMPRMYMALAQEDRHPITDILRQTPDIPDGCQWALFLRNHDELTLEMVTDEERDYLWKTYAVDPRARINLGIRRRLASLMDNDRRKIELMNVLLFSMRGTPVIYYGDEIGMGDNFYLGDRDGVRTPMQWSIDRNAGFSRADPQRLYLPLLMDPIYGYQAVNVESQQSDASSLLNWTRRMVSVRKNNRAFGRGGLDFIFPGNRRILSFLREFDGETILCVANLSRSAQAAELDLSRFKGSVPIELTGGSSFPPIGNGSYLLTLPAYGYFWFVLADQERLPRWYAPAPEPLPELITLVMGDSWQSMLGTREGRHLEHNVLKQYVARQRWYAAKQADIDDAQLQPLASLSGTDVDHMLSTLKVRTKDGADLSYFLPFALHWKNAVPEAKRPYALAKVRRGARLGTLYDGAADEHFVATLISHLRARRSIAVRGGELKFNSTPALPEAIADEQVKIIGADQSNASAIVGNDIMIKVYRRIEAGLHPEVEMARYLSERVGFENTPRFMGHVELTAENGESTVLAIAQEFVHNQGDAWHVVTEALTKALEEYGLNLADEEIPKLAFPAEIGKKLGRRTADLHVALAKPTEDAAFAPEPITSDDIAKWVGETRREADATFAALRSVDMGWLPPETRQCVEQLLDRTETVAGALDQLERLRPSGDKSRIHGDFHLGQILVAKNDLVIVDFEGEPSRPQAERHAKSSPLNDLAGALRSLDYAAWTALDRVRAEGVVASDALGPLALRWRDRQMKDCIASYRKIVKGAGAYPQDEDTADGLLLLFLLRKALYELRYEIGSRPTWLSIPTRGILGLLDSIGGAR
jgi:maltose alpha-D-glucosyltransferase/alpha-amylase